MSSSGGFKGLQRGPEFSAREAQARRAAATSVVGQQVCGPPPVGPPQSCPAGHQEVPGVWLPPELALQAVQQTGLLFLQSWPAGGGSPLSGESQGGGWASGGAGEGEGTEVPRGESGDCGGQRGKPGQVIISKYLLQSSLVSGETCQVPASQPPPSLPRPVQ